MKIKVLNDLDERGNIVGDEIILHLSQPENEEDQTTLDRLYKSREFAYRIASANIKRGGHVFDLALCIGKR